VVVRRKTFDVEQGHSRLFDKVRYFFYVTNAAPSALSARRVVEAANQRCDQENTIGQLKACHALAAPLDGLAGNVAYMAIASLAWTLLSAATPNPRKPPQPARRQRRRTTKPDTLARPPPAPQQLDNSSFSERLIED